MGRSLVISKDKFSGNVGTIVTEHKKIHEGNGFNSYKSLTDGEVISPDDKVYICASVGDNAVHLKNRRVSFNKSRVKLTIYEGAEFDIEDGNEINSYSMNRTNVKPSGMKLINSAVSPDVDNSEIIVQYQILGAEVGAGNRLVGSTAFADNVLEYVYKPNEKYVLEIENIGAEDIDFMNIYWFWYLEGGDIE